MTAFARNVITLLQGGWIGLTDARHLLEGATSRGTLTAAEADYVRAAAVCQAFAAIRCGRWHLDRCGWHDGRRATLPVAIDGGEGRA